MNTTNSNTTTGALDNEHDAPDIAGFISRAEVCVLTSLSATTIWREIRAGRFPEPVILSPNRKAFRATDIAEWMRGRTAKLQIQTPGR